ncbi:alpha/beta fold hydrolase [Rhodococcus chondri]|uniref:Alpha/beta fold hydrolase n=1 Tax=Rhodococcus chondri TaxID=3065941 RepID=A0ABU7JZD5_9NOCA|nr:alpha/beta fold hydrolase [Rhodococcus sp. CC-R104]MEE2035375.1 alpha/beta fold hydrolase [Rhodococcus sp. CC-R104]
MVALTQAQIAAAPMRIGAAAIAGWSTYLLGLARRGGTPFTVAADMTRFCLALTTSAPPAWAHPWPVVAQWPLAKLRDCGDPSATDRETVPTLLLPPQAGTHSCIVDHSPGRSQVEALRAGGLTRLHCLEWAPGSPETDGCSIDEHLAVVHDAVAHLGGRVNLIGDSQGGWLGTIYAALHPEAVHTLTVAGAPIDFHIEQPALATLAQTHTGAAASLVDLWYDAARAAGLQTTDPIGEIERAMTLLAKIHDPDEVTRIEAERRWFAWKQEIPAAFLDWIMRKLFVGNELVEGTLVVQDGPVDLGAIHCPLHLIAGSSDILAAPAQVLALAERVGTAPSSITTTVIDAGHIGLFIGRAALTEVWTPHARLLAAASR